MSLSRKVTNFNIGTGAAATTVTVAHGLGEAPKVIILLWGGATAAVDSAAQGTAQRGIGFAIGNGVGQMYALGSTEEHNVAAPANQARRCAISDGCLVSATVAGAVDGKADVQSWDATNVVFEILDAFAVSLRVTMIALSGSDIQNVAVGSFTAPNVTGLVSYTGLGFNPIGGGRSALLLASDSRTSAFGGVETDSNLSIGVAVSAAQQGVLYGGARNAPPTTTISRRYIRSTEVGVACPVNSPNSIDWRGSFNAWVTDGFQLNHVEVDASRQFRSAFLVINGPSFAVLNGLIPTVDSTGVDLTGAGFAPVAGLLLTDSAPESAASTTDTEEVWSVGAFADNGGIGQHAHEMASDHGVATSAVSIASQDRIMVSQSVSSGALNGYGIVGALLADGISLTAQDGFPTASSIVLALLVGAAPAAGGPTLTPEGLEIGFAVPLGLLGWDIGTPIEAPADMPIGLVIGNPVVQIENAGGGGETPPPSDPGFNAQQIIDAARDRHSSFDKQRHPNPILLRTLDRAQRTLFGKAILKYPQLFAATHTFTFPLLEFAAGTAIPFSYHTLLSGDAVLIDGARLSFDLVPYGQRSQPVPFYSGWVLGSRLFFKGEEADWGGVVAVEVKYVPTIDKLTALNAVLTLPRTAEDALVNALAAFMAVRGHNDPQLPPIDTAQFIRDAETSEEMWLAEVAAMKRSQIKQIREAW